MTIRKSLLFLLQLVVLTPLFLVFYIGGAMMMAATLPPMELAEPGPLSPPWDFVAIGAAHTLVIMLLILGSRWRGWRLMLAVSLVYYGCVTFITQTETAYFLTRLTVGPETMPALFLMGLPTAFLFVPLAVVIMGRARSRAPIAPATNSMDMPIGQWVWKLAVIIAAYWLLYYGAGYFIAWQNPDVRAFYGGEDLGSFWLQMQFNLVNDPWLPPYQALRALLWVLCALPVINMTTGSPWRAALLVGLIFAVPSNMGHLLANPLIPDNSVRMSHLVETMSSTFVFGLIVVWLLHRRHDSLADLLGTHSEARQSTLASGHR